MMARNFLDNEDSRESGGARYGADRSASSRRGQPLFFGESTNHHHHPSNQHGLQGRTRVSGTRLHSDDLVLEDSIEDGETLLGDGMSSLFAKSRVDTTTTNPSSKMGASRPKSSRNKGMSGPITSSIDETEKRRLQRYNRPNTGRRHLDDNSSVLSALQQEPVTVTSGSKTSSVKAATDLLGPSKSRQESIEASLALLSQHREKEEIDNILSMGTKKPNANRQTTARSSRHSTAPKTNNFDDIESYDYDIHKSSISSDKPPSRPQSGTNSRPNSGVNSLSPPSSSSGSSSRKDAGNSENTNSRTRGTSKIEKPCVIPPFKSESRSSLKVMDFEDMDDLEELGALDIGPSFVGKQTIGLKVDSKPIDLKTAVELKTLVFGDAKQCFNDEWKYQSFTFSDARRLKYGFVQKKGGPCGILAAVQATLLHQLLFAEGKTPSVSGLAPRDSVRTEALAVTIATILWRAGQEQLAVVTLPSFRPQFVGGANYRCDNLTETLFINTFTNYEDLATFLRQNISQFEFDGTSGVILALYSAILSRSVEGVRSDMDETGSKLMGAHCYCTQDMVNLFLTGRAAPNVFNDIMELDSGQGQVTVLKGIHRRSTIGFLSLFEHYGSCEVGTYYKTPKRPIWVVCSESHFSVLFSLKKELLSDWKAEHRFDLYYYDGLGRQEDEIRLSIITNNRFFQLPSDDDLVPPLEHCIRTKWAGAEVDWNGTDPLL